MSSEFLDGLEEVRRKGEPFAVATVVKIAGSASAKPSSKAIIGADGSTLFGWVGGGCAETTVAQEALESFKDGSPRLVEISLEDEVKGVGMPCGGTMQVYVEPYLIEPELLILGHGAIAETLAYFGHLIKFRIVVDDPMAKKENFPTADILISDDIDLEKFTVTPNTYVVVATQHKSDDKILYKVLQKPAAYIALVASKKRTGIVFNYLRDAGIPESLLANVRAPAGLDLNAITPQEIALSIIAEIVGIRRGGSGLPLMELSKAVISNERQVERPAEIKSVSARGPAS